MPTPSQPSPHHDARTDLGGTVVEVEVSPGDVVAAGATLLWVESMKMHHPVTAPVSGVVRAVAVGVGETVVRDAVVARIEAGARDEEEPGADRSSGDHDAARRSAEGPRADLAELLARRAWLDDAARPEQVARRHAAGRRTARENLADLVDPGTWVEYGGLAVAGQRAVRSDEELVARTPADGFIAGIGSVNTDVVGPEASSCAVASYDYMVLAGTQGMVGHLKKDRLFDVVARTGIPAILFAEGGGGRPSDTDYPVVSGLTTNAFRLWAGLSVPRIGIASGFCFAGNAGLLGACDVVIATRDASIGMGGPAMIAGAGLGDVAPADVGPAAVHYAAGSVDLLVDDDAAAVQAARRAVSYVQGPVAEWTSVDQDVLRDAVPLLRSRSYDVRAVLTTVFDAGSSMELGGGFGGSVATFLARLEGRAVGVLASDPTVDAGAVTAAAAAKAVRFLELCNRFGLPVVMLLDTPGIMVGPEAEATGLVRHAGNLFRAGAALRVPSVAVVLRRAYGLGAQALAGGALTAPLATFSWPTGEFGAMGIEGAVSFALRPQLAAVSDPAERQRLVDDAVAELYRRGRALSVASYLEIDDVIDPAQTRQRVATVFRAARRRGA